jgi:acetoacetate decarboxylase
MDECDDSTNAIPLNVAIRRNQLPCWPRKSCGQSAFGEARNVVRCRRFIPSPRRRSDRATQDGFGCGFIRMPDSNGFGDYTESGQVIPVSFRGRRGSYTHCMFLNDEGPIAGGRELWGFPKKLAQPTLRTEVGTLVGTLDYGPLGVATGTMGYKHREADLAQVKASLAAPNFLLKIIPHVDGTPRICELVEYYLEDVTIRGAWTGPAALYLTPHALAPVADLPVIEVVSAVHIMADLTLGLGKVVHDYLQQPSRRLLQTREMSLVG